MAEREQTTKIPLAQFIEDAKKDIKRPLLGYLTNNKTNHAYRNTRILFLRASGKTDDEILSRYKLLSQSEKEISFQNGRMKLRNVEKQTILSVIRRGSPSFREKYPSWRGIEF